MTTPGKTLGDWKAACRFTTCVDSAWAGSHAEASFFSALVSLPASGPSTATTRSQKTRTSHLVRRPLGTRARARAVFIGDPPGSATVRGCGPGSPQPVFSEHDISHAVERARYISLTSRESTIATVATGLLNQEVRVAGYQISGCRPRHGRAASSWADSEISVPSAPIRPASMTPIGRPAGVQCSGTLTAGWPELLYRAVHGVNRFCRSKFSAGLTSSK